MFKYADCYTIGFVTGVTQGEIQSVGGGSEVLNIYIPVTPTTAGFVVFVPKKDVIYLSMSVEDAIKNMRVIDALFESGKSGQWINI